METQPRLEINKSELQKTYRVENVSGFDIVVNLDYSNKQEMEELLDIVKRNPSGEDFSANNSWQNLLRFKLEGDHRFFVKTKKAINLEKQVNFARGQETKEDPLHPRVVHDFDKKSRYARAGIMNEIIMSKKVKEIISSPEAQHIAKENGFDAIEFSEPILAIVHKGENDKTLIYKNIIGERAQDFVEENYHSNNSKLSNLALDLRRLFFENNIYPHDLRVAQFMIYKKDGKPVVVLLDIEAYTEKEKKES